MFTKKKVKNRSQHTQIKTIDSAHSARVRDFAEIEKDIQLIEEKRQNVQSNIDILNKKLRCELTDEEFTQLFNAEQTIKEYDRTLDELRNSQNDYYLKTGHLLFNYYVQKDGSTTQNSTTDSTEHSSSQPSVMDFFTQNNETKQPNHLRTPSSKSSTTPKKNNLNEIIDQYMNEVDETHTKPPEIDPFMEFCETCNSYKIFNETESTLLCPKCGVQDHVLMNHNKPSYKDPPREYTFFAYKRINHFNEWLSQFQAKESTHIPDQIIENLELEIKKERLRKNKIKRKQVRRFLKKLGYNKYYEHIPHIINRLNGVPPPIITLETEETLRSMFKMIQVPFVKHCPEKRKNFLSYSYVLHKFVQLLGMYELTSCFTLLKSRQKLYQQDIIWKHICHELDWPFIKSV